MSPSPSRYLHGTTQTQRKRTHSCLEWDSNPPSQCLSGRRIACLRQRGAYDQHKSVFVSRISNEAFLILTVAHCGPRFSLALHFHV
jgi:hypothetical protein